jgi:hypothetical protein
MISNIEQLAQVMIVRELSEPIRGPDLLYKLRQMRRIGIAKVTMGLSSHKRRFRQNRTQNSGDRR